MIAKVFHLFYLVKMLRSLTDKRQLEENAGESSPSGKKRKRCSSPSPMRCFVSSFEQIVCHVVEVCASRLKFPIA